MKKLSLYLNISFDLMDEMWYVKPSHTSDILIKILIQPIKMYSRLYFGVINEMDYTVPHIGYTMT